MLYLYRGISGSGKSTAASALAFDLQCQYVEADMFHMTKDGYDWSQDNLSRGHQWCLLETERLHRLFGDVVVSNTFTMVREIIPFLDLTERLETDIMICEPNTEWCKNAALCWERNVHKVPLEIVERQLQRWQNVPQGKFSPKYLRNLLTETLGK